MFFWNLGQYCFNFEQFAESLEIVESKWKSV